MNERSSAAHNPKGIANFGECLLCGFGGPENTALGLVLSTDAAHLGSNLASCTLGEAFFHGKYNLPKDPVRARYWLKKVADGECKIKHLTDSAKATAAEMLRELDG